MHKVLIVDDDEEIREVVREALEEEGYWVACAKNGLQAIDLLRAEPEPCLVLLDLIMPVVTGWQFRALQLQDDYLVHFPVVVMSDTPTLEDAAIQADGLVRKPLSLEALLEEVARFCTPADFADAAPTERWQPDPAITAALAVDESGPNS